MTSSTNPSSSTTTNNTRFTEAVPLSLSSMAHLAMPLEDGVVDGLKMVVQHTLLSCVNYARSVYAPYNWNFRDLATTAHAWEPHEIDDDSTATGVTSTKGKGGGGSTAANPATKIPTSLTKHGFEHKYQRTALVYLKELMTPATATTATTSDSGCTDLLEEQELEFLATDETSNGDSSGWDESRFRGVLAKISLLYASTDKMAPDEIKGTTPTQTPAVLYKVLVEYRSLPATGKRTAVQAEELSMLSFGGGLDDDVKYGALAGLYDETAKYVLEIYGVRSKKYKFDLMDSTLSDGTVPRLPTRPGTDPNHAALDPFVKSLCLTVSDHDMVKTGGGGGGGGAAGAAGAGPMASKVVDEEPPSKKVKTADGENGDGDGDDKKVKGATEEPKPVPSFALTRIHLSLEGNLRTELLDQLPPTHLLANEIQETFLCLNHDPPEMVVGLPSGNRLILKPSEAGKIYVNGRYVTTWGDDPKIGSHFPALFGMDVHSIPYWHGRIFDYDALMMAYAALWQEVMTDARLLARNINGRLLSRLITGKDPILDDEDDYDDEDLNDNNGGNDMDDDEEEIRMNTDIDCLESQVMSSTNYDPVGISAKALATKFQYEYGDEGFPCLANELDWVKDRLPGRVPIAVPPRVIDVLRRGGYFDTKRTSDEVWFSQSRPAKEGTVEEELVQKTCDLLKEAKCTDVNPSSIVFIKGEGIFGDPVRKKGLVRFNRALRQYHVNEAFLSMDLDEIMQVQDGNPDDDGEEKKPDTSKLAMLLGLEMAKEHPDGSLLLRYMLQHGKSS
eukprot:CAMPEP_0113490160 /NCGR_PEP_ID=MMETSP0014_2-20120614/26902_1 /TAXON_ID=2857 /ORGANISM="Nitzschia sp." /LENGTH=785 /DNA_ID=CAMNT_0000383921 /DNA_START=456 /DNA_END=2813 /DNA_ORIENTATION=- /assembly_acc=CAM_ASM_000159